MAWQMATQEKPVIFIKNGSLAIEFQQDSSACQGQCSICIALNVLREAVTSDYS
jgi:hypothetical protein